MTCGFSLRISRQRFASPKTRPAIPESVSPLRTTYVSKPGRSRRRRIDAADKVSIASPTTTAPIPSSLSSSLVPLAPAVRVV